MSATSFTPIFDEVVALLGIELDLDGGSEPAEQVEDEQADVDTTETETAA